MRFTEKYGYGVGVIESGREDETYSRGLCGGTNVCPAGEIAFFDVVSEESLGAGVRRIEGVTGRGAQRMAQERLRLLDQTAAVLRVPVEQVDRAVRNLYADLQSAQKETARLKAQLAMQQIDRLAAAAVEVSGVKVVAAEIPEAEMQTLRDMSDKLREQLGTAVVVLATTIDDKPQFIAAVTDDLLGRGAHAGELVKAVARVVGGDADGGVRAYLGWAPAVGSGRGHSGVGRRGDLRQDQRQQQRRQDGEAAEGAKASTHDL